MTAKDSAGLESRLVEHTAVLEHCHRKLDEFVGLKCHSFPRMFLLSRSDIVRLISCGYISQLNAEVYQAAVRVCFPGVESLQVFCIKFAFFCAVLCVGSFKSAPKKTAVVGWLKPSNQWMRRVLCWTLRCLSPQASALTSGSAVLCSGI
jgi:hypothetical protein